MKKVFIKSNGIDKIFSFKIFNRYLWYSYHSDNCGWFRLFGLGLTWKNLNKIELLFSERNGYIKGYKFKNWYFKILKNNLYEL